MRSWLGISPAVKNRSAANVPSKRYGSDRWLKTWTNALPLPGSSQPATRPSNACQLRMCSNISIDITRSNRPDGAKALTSAVTTSTFRNRRRSRSASIHCRCPAEFDTPTTDADG